VEQPFIEATAVRQKLLVELTDIITSIMLTHPVRVAIDGIDGSGKSSLADELAIILGGRGRKVIRASCDGFHQPRTVRYHQGRSSPRGYFEDSFNNESIICSLLLPLGPGGDRRHRCFTFDYKIGSAHSACLKLARNQDILLFDGVFLSRPELRNYWDFVIFVEAPFDIALDRAVSRDEALPGREAELRRLYRERYFPGQKIYIEECAPRQNADVIFKNEPIDQPTLILNKYDLR
jgi:uridine kinase